MMRVNTVIRCVLLLGSLVSVAAPVHSQSLMSGDIVEFVRTIKDAMPDMGTNKFFIPTNAHLNVFDTLFIDVKNANYTTIAARASQFGYQFIRFVNTATGDTLLVFKENVPVLRGWGTYMYCPSAAYDLAIEAPHPLWDTNSWELAVRLFIRSDAKWFLLAGTHRYCNSDSSSDMAHVTQSVFHVCHKRAATSCAIQIHGFSKTGANAGYPDAVISNGTLTPPAVLYTLENKYISKGFTAGVFSASTYAKLNNLGATTNTQGLWSSNNGKTFVHIEHDYPLRTTLSKQLLCVDAIAEVFAPAATPVRAENAAPSVFSLFTNYPNPFNPSTTITFYAPADEWMQLSVCDMSGKEIAVLVNGRTERGFHSVAFNAERYSSGIYYCNIKTHSFTRTMKMVLTK